MLDLESETPAYIVTRHYVCRKHFNGSKLSAIQIYFLVKYWLVKADKL